MKKQNSNIKRKRIPPTRKYALSLLGLNVLAVIRFNAEKGESIITSIWKSLYNFVRDVIVSAHDFEVRMGGNTIFLRLQYILLIIFLILFVIMMFKKAGRRSFRRMFDENEPDEEYYKLDQTYQGKITVEGLDKYDSLLRTLAEITGVNEVVFRYIQETEIRSKQHPRFTPIVEIGDRFLSKVSRIHPESLQNQFFVFAVCHELMHVKNRDSMDIIWRVIAAFIVWLDGFVLIGINVRNIWLKCTMIFFWIGIFSVYTLPSYWSRCAECCADIGAIRAGNLEAEKICLALSRYSPKMSMENETKPREMIFNTMKVFFRGKVIDSDIDGHPSIKQRRREMERKRKRRIISRFKQDESYIPAQYQKWTIIDNIYVGIVILIGIVKNKE